MNKKSKKASILALLLCISISSFAVPSVKSSNDSISSPDSIPHKEKNLRFSILGGPGYTPDYGFLVGGAALFTFRTNKNDTTLQRSVLPFSFGLTFAKPIGINMMLKPQMFFNGDKWRLFGQYVYKNTNDNYYGIGYSTNKHIDRGEQTKYFSSLIQINPVFLFRIAKTPFYVGPMVDFIKEHIKDPGSYIVKDPLFIKQD